MKEKILVIGCTGLFGSTIFKYLIKKNITYGTVSGSKNSKIFHKYYRKNIIKLNKVSIKNLDDFIKKLNKIVLKKKITLLVNTFGYTPSQKKRGAYYQLLINSVMPKKLSLIAQNNNIHLIHFSTDCVFSGKKGFYTENDYKDYISNYGKYKSIGEISACKNTCTLRTSGIGHEIVRKKSLLEWFLNNKNSKIYGYRNAFFSGPTVLEIAKIIKKYFINKKNKPYGIFNIGGHKISKLDLLNLVNTIYKTKKTILEKKLPKIDRSLNINYFKKKFGYKIKSWPNMIKEMRKFETKTL